VFLAFFSCFFRVFQGFSGFSEGFSTFLKILSKIKHETKPLKKKLSFYLNLSHCDPEPILRKNQENSVRDTPNVGSGS